LRAPIRTDTTEYASVQKRGKERGRSWLASGPWVFLFLVFCCLTYWYFNREPEGISLKYGELVQVLSAARDDPAHASVTDLKVGRTEISGKSVTTDDVAGGYAKPAPVGFRTLRLGLENDQDLYKLLKAASIDYKGEEDETVLKGITSIITMVVL